MILHSQSWIQSKRASLTQLTRTMTYFSKFKSLLEAVSAIGLDKTLFGLHSLRSGGASQAANNNVTDRLFKAHGRWRSENAKDGYVKDSLLSKLSVTKLLSI